MTKAKKTASRLDREIEARRMAEAIASAVPVSSAPRSPAQLDREIAAMDLDTGTSDTMPAHHWVSAVLDRSGVSERDMVKFVTRERLAMWRHHGETVSGAADMVKRMVTNGRREERADDEVDGLRGRVRAAFRVGR